MYALIKLKLILRKILFLSIVMEVKKYYCNLFTLLLRHSNL